MADIHKSIRQLNERLTALERQSQEPAICMVRDPDQGKFREFQFKLDRALLSGAIPKEIHWRTLWLHCCHRAIMMGDQELLELLIGIYPLLGNGEKEWKQVFASMQMATE